MRACVRACVCVRARARVCDCFTALLSLLSPQAERDSFKQQLEQSSPEADLNALQLELRGKKAALDVARLPPLPALDHPLDPILCQVYHFIYCVGAYNTRFSRMM